MPGADLVDESGEDERGEVRGSRLAGGGDGAEAGGEAGGGCHLSGAGGGAREYVVRALPVRHARVGIKPPESQGLTLVPLSA